jgi:hypothetical protein
MVNKIIVLLLSGFLLKGCSCEEPSFERAAFDIQYNDSYDNQFDINGIYKSMDEGLPQIIIFYENGIVFFPDPGYYVELHDELNLDEDNYCDISFTGGRSEAYYWSFYKIDTNKITIETLTQPSYPYEKYKTVTVELTIVNRTTVEYTNNPGIIYEFANCISKPDSIDYWSDK